MDTESSASKGEQATVTDKVISLSDRQLQVLALIAEGATDHEIALQLDLAKETISWYVKCIRERLGVRSRAHAVAVAMRSGLLPQSQEWDLHGGWMPRRFANVVAWDEPVCHHRQLPTPRRTYLYHRPNGNPQGSLVDTLCENEVGWEGHRSRFSATNARRPLC